IALFGSIEVAVFCAMLIHIFNSFYVLSSVGGFFESSKIQAERNDIILLEDDRIKASHQKNAALTLPRLILAKGPLKEPDLVKNFYVISIICGLFSIIATLFMQWTFRHISIITIVIVVIIFLVPTIIALYYFPRIKGIIGLMILLLTISSIFLIFVDVFIMSLNYPDINLIIVGIPINIFLSFLLYLPMLIIWYYLTIKYFWGVMNKIKEDDHIE
ncbi:MAG: hypothetical protein ACFFAO_21815, partial [Candidatus Hermodarchaeota archaeon]